MDQKTKNTAWLPSLPPGGWRRVIVLTGIVTLMVNVLAIAGTLIANYAVGRPSLPIDIYASVALATTFTLPLFGVLQIKMVELGFANEQLRIHATTDFLTGALNRRAFMEGVEARLRERGTITSWTEPALLVIDVDHFKSINDRYGHQIGDMALVRIADTLRDNLRSTDLFGRLGGEEFGVFLEDISPADAIRLAEQCRIAIMECPFTLEGEGRILSVSIGIAIATPGEDFTALFHEADDRLYLAKAHGRNRIESPMVSAAA